MPERPTPISGYDDCKLDFERTAAIGTRRSRYSRDVVETFRMQKSGETNVSHKSLSLRDEMIFLNNDLRESSSSVLLRVGMQGGAGWSVDNLKKRKIEDGQKDARTRKKKKEQGNLKKGKTLQKTGTEVGEENVCTQLRSSPPLKTKCR